MAPRPVEGGHQSKGVRNTSADGVAQRHGSGRAASAAAYVSAATAAPLPLALAAASAEGRAADVSFRQCHQFRFYQVATRPKVTGMAYGGDTRRVARANSLMS